MNERIWLAAVLGLLAAPAVAGQGVAELSLDRSAVTELLVAALPEPLRISMPGIGEASLGVGPPDRVEFLEGGIEATLPLEIGPGVWSTRLAVRLVPEVEPLTGTIRLRAVALRPERALPVPIDLTAWVDAFELPRRLDWVFDIRHGAALDVVCFLQGVEVRDERLVLELGLLLRSKRGADARASSGP